MEQHFISPVFENIWRERYCKNGETYEGNLRRVADFCGHTAAEREAFYRVMQEGKFFPGGRTMSNSGIGTSLTLNNCFVAPQIQDDLGAIFDTVKLAAITHQKGGGIGFDFSALRPSGTPTSNDAIASGPVSFANVFNAQTATILQGGRRGANMGILNVYHPDIEEFVQAKATDAGVLNHFNLSVMVDNDFMEAADSRKDIMLHWPVYNEKGEIENDSSKWVVTKSVNAGQLWDMIMRKAYDNGEPGIFFYDNLNKDNNLWYEGKILSSNPCGEFLGTSVFNGTLPPNAYGGACNLGSLMLHQFVVNPFQEDAHLDMDALKDTIRTAVRFLDNIIDVNKFPSQIYENYQNRYRTIGLGYTGLADMLVMLGLRYDSFEGMECVDYLTRFIVLHAYQASIELAKEKGSFPGLNTQKFMQSGFLKKHLISDPDFIDEWGDVLDGIAAFGIRNAELMSVAPTGTMSLTFGNNCSSGIEPIFSLSYDRKVKMGGQGEDNVQTVSVEDYAYHLYKTLKAKGVPVVDDPPFITALEVPVSAHVNMLGVIAAHVDMSVSKTINVPTEYSFEDCKKIYWDCWTRDIKGCTIFRPNALRPGVLVEKKEAAADEQAVSAGDSTAQLRRGDVIDCDDSLVGVKKKLTTGCGSLHVMAWFDPASGDIMEVFVGKGSSGGCEKNLTAMTRLISACLRGGVPFDYVMDQLESCGGCSAYKARQISKHDTSPGSSCATAIAKALKKMQREIYDDIVDSPDEDDASNFIEVKHGHASKESTAVAESAHPVCPECGEEIVFEGGCNICKACGWSKCS